MLAASSCPLALAAWVWLLVGARSLPDAPWRARVERLARAYVALFSVMTVVAVVRDRLCGRQPRVPLVVDVFLVLTYTLITVLWVESAERSARVGSGPRAQVSSLSTAQRLKAHTASTVRRAYRRGHQNEHSSPPWRPRVPQFFSRPEP